MPTYEYRCAKCDQQLEVFQSFADAPLTKHEACGGKLRKVLSPAGVILKGSGFYKTDNRSSSTAKTSDKGESKTSESKTSESKSPDGSGSSSSSSSSSGSKPAAKSA